MFKAKQKLTSMLVVFCTLIVTLLLGASALIMPSASNITASAATTEIVFELGANGSATHADGTSKTSYTETDGTYTLNLTNVTNMYTGARDAKGNSCIKLGASSKAGSFKFTVPEDVTSVIIAVGKYKANTTKITVNSKSYTISGASNNGEYDAIEVDTSSTKTVSFTTVSGGYRAMVNTITYVIESSSEEPACEHVNQTTTTTEATCTVAGSTVVTCDDCGETISTTELPATGHQNQTTTTTDATCTEAGSIVVTCDDCGATVSSEAIDALGHSIESVAVSNDDGTHNLTGTCTVCGESATETKDCTLERTDNEDTVTYTCSECGYTYDVNKYTVTYVIPEGVAAVESVKVEANTTITLETADNYDKYAFVGWTTATLENATTEKPEMEEAGTEYIVTEDITFYALYTYSEGSGQEVWQKVTVAPADWSGTYLIVYEAGTTAYIFNATDVSNGYLGATINNSTIEANAAVNAEAVVIATMEGGYSILTKNGYIYGSSSGNKLSFNKTTAQLNTIALADNGSVKITSGRVLQFNATSGQNRFRYYTAGNQSPIYLYELVGGANIYYTSSFSGCAHTSTREETTPATCTETGLTKVICDACSAVLEEIELPALGHNYVDNFCSVCGEQDPATIDYSGYYYISFTHGETVYYADNSQLSSNRYYAKTEAPEAETVAVNYLYRLEKTAVGIYTIYEFDGDCYQENVTVEKVGDIYRFYATVDGDACQFLLNAGSSTKYIKFYKASNATQSNYAQDITLTPVELSANIDEATITIGDDITLNYYVSMSAAFEGAEMYFTVDGETYDVAGVLVGESYKFSLNVPPHYMTTNVKAVLVYGEFALDLIENYSIQTYAQNQLNNEPSEELKQLLIDLLYYGAAAQNYKAYNTDNLANAGIENNNTAAPDATDFTLVKNEEVDSYPAYFMGAGVFFDNVNKIFVKLSTTENVTLTINGTEVEVNGSVIYTDGILATEFDTTYTFELYCDGVLMQTLTYSVNAYAYAKQNDTAMGELALALYRYGVSASAYKA